MAKIVRIVEGPIDFNEALAAVRSPRNGGLATFYGSTRDNSDGKAVERLFYEAYEPMAVAKMDAIAAEIAETWGVTDIAMVHRIGEVPIGEVSVFIAAGSAHRDEAFSACRFAIDTLKETVPIWKKEFFDDGEVWVGQTPSDRNTGE